MENMDVLCIEMIFSNLFRKTKNIIKKSRNR
jgi:hypothetical protein